MAQIKSKEEALTFRLGSDLKYPITGSFESISGVQLLIQDIQRLLLTLPGERPFRPDFGCNLRNQVWENIDSAAINGNAAIRDALERFEPRISVNRVAQTINRNSGLITYTIQFFINSDDTPVNLIFPFRTGTQLSFG